MSTGSVPIRTFPEDLNKGEGKYFTLLWLKARDGGTKLVVLDTTKVWWVSLVKQDPSKRGQKRIKIKGEMGEK